MSVFSLGGNSPQLGQRVWIAPNAAVIGDVRLGDDVSVWWSAVLRGDNDPITIGASSNIQDGSVLHTDEGIPLTIGTHVTVGHQAALHGCTVGDGSLVGIGAVILNRAVIGRHSIVGAHALIPEGKVFPDRALIVGAPGRMIRLLNDEEVERLRLSAEHYIAHAARYRNELSKAPG